MKNTNSNIFCDFPGCKEQAICPTETMCDWYSKRAPGMGWEYRQDIENGNKWLRVCSKHKFKTMVNPHKNDIKRYKRK